VVWLLAVLLPPWSPIVLLYPPSFSVPLLSLCLVSPYCAFFWSWSAAVFLSRFSLYFVLTLFNSLLVDCFRASFCLLVCPLWLANSFGSFYPSFFGCGIRRVCFLLFRLSSFFFVFLYSEISTQILTTLKLS